MPFSCLIDYEPDNPPNASEYYDGWGYIVGKINEMTDGKVKSVMMGRAPDFIEENGNVSDFKDKVADSLDIFLHDNYSFSADCVQRDYDPDSLDVQEVLNNIINSYDKCNQTFSGTGIRTQWWPVIQVHQAFYDRNNDSTITHSEEMSLRWPNKAEIRAQAYLAISHGAKGIMAWCYGTTKVDSIYTSGLEGFQYVGLVGDSSTYSRDPNNPYNDTYYDLKEVFAEIDSLGDELLNLNWVRAYGQGDLPCGIVQSATGNSLDFGEFTHKADTKAKYLMVTNRLCYSGQTFTLVLNPNSLWGSNRSYLIEDVRSGGQWYRLGSNISFSDTLEPGQGKLYRIRKGPARPTVSINSGAQYTNSSAVSLSISAESGVTRMKVSNGPSGGTWEDFSSTKSWTLSSGDGTKTVYVWVAWNQASQNYPSPSGSDDIILDTHAPEISSVGASHVTATSAKINWSTNEPSNSEVDYGTTTSYGLVKSNSNLVTSHSISLSGLSPHTTYHYRVRSKDAAGNEAISGDRTFTTQNRPPYVTDVTVSPSNPKTTDNLTVSYSYHDPDGDSESGTEFHWYKNGSLTSYTGRTLPSSATSKGQSWYAKVKPKDGRDFGSEVQSNTVTVQNSPPEITGFSPSSSSVTMDEGDSQNFSVSASDADGDALSYTWTKDGAEVGSGTSYTYNPGYDEAGSHTVKVTVSDGSNSTSHSWSVTVNDVPPPPTPTVTINSGAQYTNSQNVTLSISAASGVTRMKVSNGPSGGTWEDFSSTKSWTLSSGDGTKTVYVWVAWNQESQIDPSDPGSDSIVLDTEGPTGSVVIEGGAQYTNSTSVSLSLSASDGLSGVSRMRISNDGVNWTEYSYSTSKDWTLASGEDGSRTVYVIKFRDGAGNWGSVCSDDIILDTTDPEVSIYWPPADNGPSSVTFQWSGSDDKTPSSELEYRYRLDGGSWSGWSSDKSKSYTGLSLHWHTFEVEVRDNAGNTGSDSKEYHVQIQAPQLSISGNYGGNVGLSWTKPEGAIWYVAKCWRQNPYESKIDTTYSTSTTFSGLESGVTYYFRVVAYCSHGKPGEWSNTVTAVP